MVEVVTSPSDAARVDLQRDQLAHEGAEGEERQLRVEEPVEGVEARAEHQHRARSARGDHQRHIEIEWVVSGGARGGVSDERWEARVPCPDNR